VSMISRRFIDAFAAGVFHLPKVVGLSPSGKLIRLRGSFAHVFSSAVTALPKKQHPAQSLSHEASLSARHV
jgi:hypothetical protein